MSRSSAHKLYQYTENTSFALPPGKGKALPAHFAGSHTNAKYPFSKVFDQIQVQIQ